MHDQGSDDCFKWATLKKNLTQVRVSDKKKIALEKISAFGSKIPKINISVRTGWEGNLGLKIEKEMKDYWRESASTVAAISHTAKIPGMVSEYYENNSAPKLQKLFTRTLEKRLKLNSTLNQSWRKS